ncbi:helix-turn-helix domain-containing protein [Actinoplanes bogorensis]|uniref:Helix-turn-helix domain-containing protein n=1 Tax=Paractinoplanes bogorensis TaxID=1610840 RepID=A0ABS5YG08_9ACTN|nr:helix-turn-helix domain-containing protein [Actinoplanes bogorensis]MBU2662288.1 helix-turn-helix domain-containing protein [Actinoplanes bogorensis]
MPALAVPEIVSPPQAGSTVVQIPDVATALAFRTTDAGRSDLFVVGPRTRGRYHPTRGVPVCVRLRLRPGVARALFGLPVSALVDRTVRLTDLWGAAGARLTDTVSDAAPDTDLIVSLLSDALAARLASPVSSAGAFPASPGAFPASAGVFPAGSPGGFPDGSPGSETGLLAAAVRLLPTASRLSDAAAELGVSERHLRNLFARETGLSPKHFARITRLRRVLDQAGTRQWSAVAGDTGFFDQAHMISDFRAFMGVTPAAYTAGNLPKPTPCADLTRLRPAA